MRFPGPMAFSILFFLLYLQMADTQLDAMDNVGVCEVLQHPQTFNGKMISIRTAIRIAFEDFEVDISPCAPETAGGIWLEYGKGPKTQPTIWCCGDLTPQNQVDLVQDSAFRKFDDSLRAMRNGKPLYAVSAILSGRFETVPTTRCPDGIHPCPRDGGFGHLGAFASRLIIHSVSEVSAVENARGADVKD